MAQRISGIYHPHSPKASPLYGLVEDHFDDFERVYEERFANRHGFWRPVIRKVADRFLDRGNLRHGFARIRCENPDCRHEIILAFSCRGRYFCPSCHAKRVAASADWLAAIGAGLKTHQYCRNSTAIFLVMLSTVPEIGEK